MANSNANVYIVNKSAHDFSAAERYGRLVFLSEGPMNRYAVNHMHRLFSSAMHSSSKDDFIVPCSLNVMNAVACALFGAKHRQLNLLLFKDGKYIERNIVL